MDFDTYQDSAEDTATYPGQGENTGLMYAALGLASEAGEVAGKVKKAWRDGNLDIEAIEAELGDVLWYAAAVATELDATLDYIATKNLEKLASRKARGVLGGNGDNR